MSETRIRGMRNPKAAWIITILVVGLCGGGLGSLFAAEDAGQAAFSSGRNFNMILVTPDGPDDGGDFGPHTPDTRTAGIQEAINHALTLPKQSNSPNEWARKPIYIAKGWYSCTDPVRLPWMGEQFVLNARDSNIVYRGDKGPAVHIDSLMNCVIEFGYVIAPALKTGPVVHCQPRTPFSWAPKGVMSNSRMEFNAIVGGGNTTPEDNRRVECVGLLLDSSSGPIICNRFFIQEVNGCHTNLVLHDAPGGGGIGANHITLLFGNLCQQLARIGDPDITSIRENTFTMNGSSGATGVQIFAQNNLFYLNAFHNTQPGQAVIFEKGARDNVVYAFFLDKGFTNNAAVPTNRIIPLDTSVLSVETPPVPASDTPFVNRNPCRVEIRIIEAGEVSSWAQINTVGKSQEFPGPLFLGQTITLEPGEQIRLSYTRPPRWFWKPLP